jgi:hypothetical protein
VLALEGIRRQLLRRDLAGAEEQTPVHRGAGDIGLGERVDESGQAALIAAKRADAGRGHTGVGDGFAKAYQQTGVRAGLDEDRESVGE